MIFGQTLILTLLILNVVTFGLYLMSLGAPDGWRRAGRSAQWLKAAVGALAVFYLGTLFVHNQFAFKYVYENSASAQELLYKISGVWAGQEGTFLLWLFFLSAVGVAVAYAAGEYEGWALIFMSALEVSICALLLKSNPFQLSPEVAADGLGMNALLKNPWMAIHPPIVFLGYALAAAPFVIFLAGAAKGDPAAWARRAWPWAVLSWGVLGIGIFLGSYWAYEVLGWGGYWGWDPVENASLFPWIALGALVHGLFLQGYRRKYVFWNGAMAAAAYILVLFSAFLTRSGVLSEFSVHSFEGLSLYVPLLTILIATGALAVALLAAQARKTIKLEKNDSEKTDARPAFLSWTVIFFWIFFAFVFVGTNFPLISRALMENASPVQTKYYNVTSMAVGVPFAVLLLLCPLYFARRAGGKISMASLVTGIAAGIAAAALCFAIGVRHPALLLFGFAGGAAAATQGLTFVKYLFSGKKNFTAYMSHLGAALLFIGFVVSTAGTKTEQLVLAPGETGRYAGGEITVVGIEPHEHGYSAILKFTGKQSGEAKLTFVSEEARGMAVNRPVVRNSAAGDVYLSPTQIVFRENAVEAPGSGSSGSAHGSFSIRMGETATAGKVQIKFEKFDLEKMKEGIVGVVIKAAYDGKEEEIIPQLVPGPEGMSSQEASMKSVEMSFGVLSIDPANKEVELGWREGQGPAVSANDTMTAAAFTAGWKPCIWIVWLGMIVVSAGIMAAALRRFMRILSKRAA
ncbi:MAG: cytochrome c biogenesis protein CcsA [bacterium]